MVCRDPPCAGRLLNERLAEFEAESEGREAP
jgi:hypothetical protein